VHSTLLPQAQHLAEVIERRSAASPQAFTGAGSAPKPSREVLEEIVSVCFWASLLQEEGRDPRITVAYMPPPEARDSLAFAAPLAFEPHVLAHLAPSVERPGIHLGVWHDGGALRVWGLTRMLPIWCVVVEVAAPGLLIVKGSRPDQVVKMPNIAVLEGATIKAIIPQSTVISDAPVAMQPLLAFYASAGRKASDDVLVRMALSMREHRRGGTLLVVPDGSAARAGATRSLRRWRTPRSRRTRGSASCSPSARTSTKSAASCAPRSTPSRG
jgi:hypothetical protein